MKKTILILLISTSYYCHGVMAILPILQKATASAFRVKIINNYMQEQVLDYFKQDIKGVNINLQQAQLVKQWQQQFDIIPKK